MKLIHTADWHLGKSLKGQPLIDDQIYILEEFLKLIDDTKPDAVIIAGDIYDRTIPPVDAVSLFDEIIFKIIERKIPVLSIAGNHDSAERLNFGSRLFEREKFFITAKANENPTPVVLNDEFGEVYFSLIPFFETAELQNNFAQAEIADVDAANKIYIDLARRKIPADKRSVAIAHLFATGGQTSDSERKFVGALENVDAANFSAYNYTALGHLHKPQNISKTVRYSGSLLKYSFSEASHQKGATLVELDAAGKILIEHVNLTPRRDVRVIAGSLDELCKSARTEDYIHAEITDKTYILNALDRLRGNAFPNILSLDFVGVVRGGVERKIQRAENISTLEYFADFYKFETGENLEGEYRAAMEKFLSELTTA